MSALTHYSGDDYRKIATQLKTQLQRNAADKDKLTRRTAALAFGLGSAGAMGYYMGTLDKKVVEEGLAEDQDPRKLGPAPIPVLVGGVLALGGVLMGGFTKSKKLAWVNDAAESAGSHILAGYVYGMARDKGRESA
jgi:hypothetical protein